jgi:hypothetical protein
MQLLLSATNTDTQLQLNLASITIAGANQVPRPVLNAHTWTTTAGTLYRGKLLGHGTVIVPVSKVTQMPVY